MLLLIPIARTWSPTEIYPIDSNDLVLEMLATGNQFHQEVEPIRTPLFKVYFVSVMAGVGDML